MGKNNISELVRVNMNLPISVVTKVKDYAESLGINVTSAYIVLLNQALEQKEAMKNLPTMLTMVNELKKLGSLMNANDIKSINSEQK